MKYVIKTVAFIILVGLILIPIQVTGQPVKNENNTSEVKIKDLINIVETNAILLESKEVSKIKVVEVLPFETDKPIPLETVKNRSITPKPLQVITKKVKKTTQISSENNKPQPSDGDAIALIEKYSDKYGANKDLMSAIVKCESGYSMSAVSPSGKHTGYWQFAVPTFYGNAKRLLDEDPNAFDGEIPSIRNGKHQTIVAIWMLQVKKQMHQWSCYSIVKNKY